MQRGIRRLRPEPGEVRRAHLIAPSKTYLVLMVLVDARPRRVARISIAYAVFSGLGLPDPIHSIDNVGEGFDRERACVAWGSDCSQCIEEITEGHGQR